MSLMSVATGEMPVKLSLFSNSLSRPHLLSHAKSAVVSQIKCRISKRIWMFVFIDFLFSY